MAWARSWLPSTTLLEPPSLAPRYRYSPTGATSNTAIMSSRVDGTCSGLIDPTPPAWPPRPAGPPRPGRRPHIRPAGPPRGTAPRRTRRPRLPRPGIATVGGHSLERADTGPVVGNEELRPDGVGGEVEDQSVVLLVHQQAVLAVGQQFAIHRHRDPVASGQDVDPVVRSFSECRMVHSDSSRARRLPRSVVSQGCSA